MNILITGASRGLGFYFAKRYLETGNCVFAGTRQGNREALLKLKETYGDALHLVALEVDNTVSVEQAAGEVKDLTDHIDIIINNAAIHADSSFEELEKADLDACLPVYNINSIGPLRVVKAFLPFLKKSSEPSIFNISSESGSIGMAGRVKEFDYCMSKAALNMGTKLLSNYLKEFGIPVFAIQPGWMRTDMGGANAHLDPYETADKLIKLFEGLVKRRADGEELIFVDNEGAELPW